MNKFIKKFALVILFLTAGCSSADEPAEFSMTYYVMDGLAGRTTNIQILDGTLYLQYKAIRNSPKSIMSDYEMNSNDIQALVNILDSVGFMKIKPLQKGEVLDPADVFIAASYNNTMNKISLTAVEQVPEKIQAVRERLFNIIEKYDRSFVREAIVR